MRLRHSTCKTSPFCSKLHPETDTFGTFFQKSCESGVFDFSWSGPQFVQNIKPIRQLLCTFSSCSDLGIYIIYNIYKFQENQRTKKASLFHSTSLTHSLHFFTIDLEESYRNRYRRITLGSRTSYLATENKLLTLPQSSPLFSYNPPSQDAVFLL